MTRQRSFQHTLVRKSRYRSEQKKTVQYPAEKGDKKSKNRSEHGRKSRKQNTTHISRRTNNKNIK